MLRRGGLDHAVAQVEDERLAGQRLQNLRRGVAQGLATGGEHDRVQVALHRQSGLQIPGRPSHRDGGVEPDRIHPTARHVSLIGEARTARETDDRNRGVPGLDPIHDAPRRFDHPAAEFARRQDARPTVEKLHHLGPGLDLGAEIIGGHLDQQIHQRPESRRVAVGPALHMRVLLGTGPLHHVAGDGPGSPCKADQRGVRRNRAGEAADGLVDRLQPLVEAVARQALQVFHVSHRVQLRPLPFLEGQRLAQRVRHHQDVGEQNRRVHVIAAQRLEGHLHRVVGVVAHVQEAAGLGAQFPIFRQVTAGLAHQPEGRALTHLAGKGCEHRLGNLGHGLGHGGSFPCK